MKHVIFLSTLALCLSLFNCGGGDDGNGGNPVKPVEKVFDPWDGVGEGTLTEGVSERIRELAFADGMTVSYDGSAEDGSERVCRRQQSEDTWYEVCMPLEDDPYFILAPNSALVWHPLAYNRFATELNCRSWMDIEDVMGEVCDTAFFEKMGGEGFSCQAKPVSGDKALVCSDHWAVAVNGLDEDTKTVCRVYTESGTGRCLGSPREGVADASLLLQMQQTDWQGYGSVRDNSGQFAPGDMGQLVAPQDTPPGARFSYASEDENVCAVDSDAVMISAGATAPDTCKIFLTVKASGYADRVLFVELPILQESDAAWADYIRSNNYFYPGEMLAAGAVSSSDPTATDNTYQSLDEAVCTVDGDSGEVTAVAPGECTVRLTAVAEGYLDTIIDKKLPVDALSEGEWSILWPDFPTDAVVGEDTAALNLPQLWDGGDTPVFSAHITIVADSDYCTYSAGVLSFVDTAECAVTVTARTTREYAPVEQTFRVTPTVGSFTLTWTGYAGSNDATFGSNAPNPVPPSISPVLSSVNYAYAADGDCTVDGATGILTLTGAGSCEVTLSASRSGYQGVEESHTVTIAKKTQTAPDAPENPYGGVLSLAVGKSIPIINAPEGGVGSLEYSTVDDTKCTVETDGTVTGAGAGTCTIQIVWSGDDDHAPTSAQNLVAALPIVATSNDAAAALTEAAYGASPDLVVGGTPLAVASAPTPGVGQTGAPEYRTGTPDKCSVDSGTGAITGLKAGECRIQVRHVGSAVVAATDWSGDLTLTVGKGAVPDIANPYGTSPTVGIGGSLELEADLGIYGSATFNVGSGPCSVDGDGTVTPTEDAAVTDQCTIQVAFGANENYEAKDAADLATIDVEAGTQILTFGEPYGTDPALMMGETLAVVEGNEPVADQGGAISYRSADTAICTVDSGTGEITPVMPGECVVQTMAAAVDPKYAATEWIELATVGVEEGILSLGWNPQRWGRVGSNLVLYALTYGGTGSVVITYSVSDAGDTGCTFSGTSDPAARTLIFTGTGVCIVTATGSKTHYADWSREHIIRVRPAAITVTPDPFSAGETLQVGDSAPKAPAGHSVTPSDATVTWQLVRGERDCELVSTTTGAVRAKAVSFEGGTPQCFVQAVASKPNYETVKSAPVSIALSLGEIGDVAIRYGSGVTNFLRTGGGTAGMTPPPMDENGVSIRITNITFEGTDTDDAAKENVCEVDTQTGRATALEDAEDTDKCVITFTVAALGYADKDVALTLPLVSEDLVFENTPTALTYTGNLQIGEDTPLVAGTLPPTDDNSVAVTWKYLVEGNCEVDNSDGALTLGGDAAAGETCTISPVASAEGFVDYFAESEEVAVVAGTLSFASADKPTFTGTLHAEGSLTPVIPDPSADDNSVAVTWENWRVDGNCPIDTATGVVSASVEGDVCAIFVTAAAPNYDSSELEIISLTVAAIGDFGVITAPEYSGKLTLRSYPITVKTEPTAANGSNITWSYSAIAKRDSSEHEATEEICSVNAQSGTVTLGEGAMTGDICEVTVTASAAGYTGKSTPLELPVHDTFVSLDWPTFLEGGGVGATIDLSDTNQPESVPVADSYAVTVASGNCTYNSTADTLVLSDTDPCVLSVTATKDNYIDLTGTFSVTADLGSITVAGNDAAAKWGTYPAVKVGAATNAPNIGATTPTGVTKSYAAGSDSPGCTVTPTGAVTGTRKGTNNCQVVVTVSKEHYNDLEHTYTLSVARGEQNSPTWSNPYGTTPTLAVGADPLALAQGAAPTNTGYGDVEYRVGLGPHNGRCSVDSGTGAVTAKVGGADNSCQIQARFVGNANYNASLWSPVASISIVKGTIAVAGANDNAKWGTYGAVRVGAATSAPGIGATTPSTSKAYSSQTSSVCSVVSGTGAVTGTTTGTCEIRLTLSATGYNDLTHDYSFTVGAGTISIAGWGGNYGTVTVGAAATAAPTLGATTPTSVTKTYSSLDPSHCTVNSSGAVTGVDDATCRIKLVLSKDHYNNLSYTYTLTVQAGTITIAGNDNAAKWGAYTGVKVGAATNAPAMGTITPTGAAKTYASRTAAVCSVDAQGAVTGVTTGTCEIRLTLSATGYNDLSHDYSFTVGAGTQTGLAWSSQGSLSARNTEDPVLAAVTGAHSSATITYAVDSAGNTGCTLGSGSAEAKRTLDFTGAGTCTVSVTVSRDNYADWSRTVTVTVTTITPVAISWTGYGSGSNSITYFQWVPAPDTATLTPTTATASYAATGSNCTVNSSTGVLTITGAGECVVTLTATPADGNNSVGTLSVTFTVNKASQSSPAVSDIYGTSPTLVTGDTLNIDTAPSGGGSVGSIEYQSATDTICSVDTDSGTITALLDGTCTVQARWGGDDDWLPSAWISMQSITIGKGTLTIDNVGDFASNLVAGSTATPGVPATTPTGATFTYALASGETDCALVTASTGEVQVADGDIAEGAECSLVVTASKPGYNDATDDISTGIDTGTLDFTNTGLPAYTGNLMMGGRLPTTAAVPTTDDNSIVVTWTFTAAGTRESVTQTGVCTVVNTAGSDLGVVTAGAEAQADDVCQIQAVASAPGFGPVSVTRSITLATPNPVELSAFYGHTCVRFEGGGLKCWGYGHSGQLGYGDTSHRGGGSNQMGSDLPWVNLGAGRGAKQVAVGLYHACATRDDDSLACWGDNYLGQLGHAGGDTCNSVSCSKIPTPTNLGTGASAKRVAAGFEYTCAILGDDSVKCWGSNDEGQLGYGNTDPLTTPPSAAVNLGTNKTAKKIDVGHSHTCAILNDDSVVCWGTNGYGQLGDGSRTDRYAPVSVNLGQGRTARQIILGKGERGHTCALLDDNSLKCWGYNRTGQLGVASSHNQDCPNAYHKCVTTPTAVSFGDTRYPVKVSAGGLQTCAILDDDSLVCWGTEGEYLAEENVSTDAYGLLGYGNTDDHSTPPSTLRVDLGEDLTARQIESALGHNCVILSNHTVKCWGNPGTVLGAGTSSARWGDGAGEMGDNLPVVDLL